MAHTKYKTKRWLGVQYKAATRKLGNGLKATWNTYANFKIASFKKAPFLTFMAMAGTVMLGTAAIVSSGMFVAGASFPLWYFLGDVATKGALIAKVAVGAAACDLYVAGCRQILKYDAQRRKARSAP